jgi:hypothetical protein
MDDRPVTSQQLEEIVERALELEQREPSLAADELRRIAEEIGISGWALEQARTEVLEGRRPPGPAPAKGRGWDVFWMVMESVVAVGGGMGGGMIAGVGFPVAGVAIAALAGLFLASRRDVRSLFRFAAQWVVLCGVFGFTTGMLQADLTMEALLGLFLGGGLIAAAIVWARERGSVEPEPTERPMIPAGPREAP